MIGRTISHYSILEKLGAGGMGDIYKAQDTRLNRFVAVKVLSTANAGDVERRRRFVQEAQAASALNHPNIITIHDVVSQDGLEFMVMEFVSGVTLDDLIPKHGLDVRKTLDYSVQIADALQAAHAAGIVHRDLKPANVMVNASGLVKILDFGIAKLTGPMPASPATDETLPLDAPMTVEGSILGTVCYMSPEQAQAKPVDPRSDIFSFGVLMYEMLTGHKAFSGDSALSTLSAILRDEAKPIREIVQGVPSELEEIVERAMRKDPAQRWQSMPEMRAALLVLKQKADSGILLTQSIPALPPGGKKKISAGLVAAIAAAVVVIAAITGGVWFVKRQAAQRGLARQQAEAAQAQAAPPAVPDNGAPAPAGALADHIAPPADSGLTNQNILDMVDAKVPQPVIINHIRSSKTNFDLSTDGIIKLTKGGVSATIIETMRNPKAPEVAAGRPQQAVAAVKNTASAPSQQTAKPVTPPAQVPVPVPAQAIAPPATPPSPPPAAPSMPASIHTVSILGGSPFTMTLIEDVPAKLTPSQPIHFQVSQDFKVGDVVVIPKGTPVTGEVADTGEGKKVLILKGKATFRLTSVTAAGGSKLAIRATPGRNTDKLDRQIEPQGHHGKDVLAPAGTEYLAYIDGDQVVTLRR